ncbi:Mnd1 family-domain-containing protein [Limtongia smithiae]|uniref:Mnd1 family-domain-containing protein n=1 Tax=Limtongia smithiae TaxID=1125753 RepID=UPI0034CF56CD
MSRKGMSAAEKSVKLLNFFRDSQSFFAIKEIEKQGAKATGINSMQIKDVLQTLLDDSLVRCEKIGSGNYYWCFLSDESRGNAAKLDGLRKKVAVARENVTSLEEKIAFEKAEREPAVSPISTTYRPSQQPKQKTDYSTSAAATSEACR